MRIPLAVASICWCIVPSYASDFIPVADGPYVRSKDACIDLRAGNLDFIDFEVLKNGLAYDLPEAGCVVAAVKQLRPQRFAVEADCMEAGEYWRHNFILDALKSGAVRVDGEELAYCSREMRPEDIIANLPPRSIDLPKKLSDKDAVQSADENTIFEDWHEANEQCRGGSGDDPATEAACTHREQLAEQLKKQGLCFGRKKQSHSDYEWHKCAKDSVK